MYPPYGMPFVMYPPPTGNPQSQPDSSMKEFARILASAYQSKEAKSRKKEEEDKKKKEGEKKKDHLTTKDVWLTMVLLSPVIGPLYVAAISYSFKWAMGLAASAFTIQVH